jgi:nucleotide-binding universal stress UspA family protein
LSAASIAAEKGTVASNYRKILVGYDGSENATRAVARAIALATEVGAAIRVVVAVNTILPVYGPGAPYYPPDYATQVMRDGEKSLEAAVSRVKDARREVSGSVEDGHPAEIILDLAESEGADLIVLGRRGISGVERFLMGGVSSSVVSHSKCDVLVVK